MGVFLTHNNMERKLDIATSAKDFIMSLLSVLNNATAAVVGAVAGPRARKVSKDTGIALGGATLDVVEVGAEILVGATTTIAAGLPAAFSYLKGMSTQALVGSPQLLKFRTEWIDATHERRGQIAHEIGEVHMEKIIKAFEEEELMKVENK